MTLRMLSVWCSSPSNLPADAFLDKLKAVVTTYQDKHTIAEGERAIFESVSDNVLDFGGSKKIHAETMDRK
jgi:hypothetical protein